MATLLLREICHISHNLREQFDTPLENGNTLQENDLAPGFSPEKNKRLKARFVVGIHGDLPAHDPDLLFRRGYFQPLEGHQAAEAGSKY